MDLIAGCPITTLLTAIILLKLTWCPKPTEPSCDLYREFHDWNCQIIHWLFLHCYYLHNGSAGNDGIWEASPHSPLWKFYQKSSSITQHFTATWWFESWQSTEIHLLTCAFYHRLFGCSSWLAQKAVISYDVNCFSFC